MATDTFDAPQNTSARELTYSRAIGVATLLVVFGMGVSILLRENIGVIADIFLVLSTVIIAVLVRQTDWIASVWAPALSWFIALITVGQFATRSTGSFKAKQAFLLVYGLGAHALWIVGCTVLAIVIHFVRQIGK